jgi:hypothetical protein
MTDDAIAQFCGLLASELEAAQHRWAKEIMKVEADATAKGAFHSGRRISVTAERLSEGLIQYRQYMFDRWGSYVRPRLASLPPTDQTAFVDVALGAFDKAIARAIAQFEARPRPSPHIDFSGPIKDTGARERRSLEAELRLYLSTPARANVTNVSTYGANSPVNVGSGTLNQQINTAEGMGELVVALVALLEAMGQVQDHRLDDVREIVIEAKDEAGKPKPNKLKLGAILGGIKTGIEGVAVLEKAWELVQHISQSLDLPI